MLRVLGRTESEISPLADKAPAPSAAADENEHKRRRKSRVSFGNIQTAIFQKDTDWTADASPSHGTSGEGENRKSTRAARGQGLERLWRSWIRIFSQTVHRPLFHPPLSLDFGDFFAGIEGKPCVRTNMEEKEIQRRGMLRKPALNV